MAFPCPLTSLIDREHALQTLRNLIARVRLVTITGPGGVGKTRVAIALARMADFPDGALFVDLAPVAEPCAVPAAIALALGVCDGAEVPLLERIVGAIGERRLLLVLDNCERVVEAAPDLARLLAAAPNLTILATSRVPLQISGEHEYVLAPLPLPTVAPARAGEGDPSLSLETIAQAPAVQLFVQRASAIRAGFTLTDANAETVATICARLDGLPLALELAAVQLRALTPAALLTQLERRLPLLKGGPRDAPARQRTLRDAIAWSVDLLRPAERRAFSRMAVFAGGCTLDAVAAVCAGLTGDEADALQLMSTLVTHSLLQRCGHEAEPRYMMLETVREYAGELLAASGEEADIRRRHADYYVALAERAEEGLLNQTQRFWFERLGAERENQRTAVEWTLGQGDGLAAARIGAALWRFWWVRGGIRQGLAWLEAGLAHLGAEASAKRDPERMLLRARALAARGNLALASAEYQLAERSHADALALYRSLDHSCGVGRSLYNLGLIAEHQGDAALAEQYYRACLAHDRNEPFIYGVGLFLRGLSATALARGESAQAYVLAQRAVEGMRARNQPLLLVQGLLQLALAALALGRVAEAERHACEAIAILRENQGQVWLAEALMVLASAIATTDPRRAARAFAAAERLLAHHHAPLAPKAYAQIVPYVRVVHDRLGAAAFATAWREGGRLSFELAGALAEPAGGTADGEPPRPAPVTPVAQLSSPPAALVARGGPDDLSARELEILQHLSTGLTNKAIAEQLLMSVNTVHSHVKAIFSKLDVTTRAAATRAALVHGLVEQ